MSRRAIAALKQAALQQIVTFALHTSDGEIDEYVWGELVFGATNGSCGTVEPQSGGSKSQGGTRIILPSPRPAFPPHKSLILLRRYISMLASV
ncbi:hypothetical protein EJ08DRAFT_653661, partial [Tothia fuscella]